MTNTKDDNPPVGYGSPPAWKRFKPGRSGNPSGRPKKIKSLKAEIIEELDELTSVTEEGHKRQVSKARAIAKAIVREAANGNLRATTALMSLFARDTVDHEPTDDSSPEERALLDNYVEREVRRRADESSPNDININDSENEVQS
jgi:Family of unknown function (DUF5681)